MLKVNNGEFIIPTENVEINYHTYLEERTSQYRRNLILWVTGNSIMEADQYFQSLLGRKDTEIKFYKDNTLIFPYTINGNIHTIRFDPVTPSYRIEIEGEVKYQ